jgi:hypothetical protein
VPDYDQGIQAVSSLAGARNVRRSAPPTEGARMSRPIPAPPEQPSRIMNSRHYRFTSPALASRAGATSDKRLRSLEIDRQRLAEMPWHRTDDHHARSCDLHPQAQRPTRRGLWRSPVTLEPVSSSATVSRSALAFWCRGAVAKVLALSGAVREPERPSRRLRSLHKSGTPQVQPSSPGGSQNVKGGR